jgi:phage-related protein (TIGR01555 family)
MSKKQKKRVVTKIIAPPPETVHVEPPVPKGKRSGVHFKDSDVAGVNKVVETVNLFQPAAPPPGVVPENAKTSSLASDNAGVMNMTSFANSQYAGIAGQGFLGYPYLAELSSRPEFRHISETIAREMTRKWITLHASGTSQQNAQDKIGKINAEFERLKLRDKARRVVELDGFFGRGHLYLDFGIDTPTELKTMLIIDPAKINTRRPLKSVKVVEPTWTYPKAYNATNPLADDYYKPQSWYVMGKEIHKTRLLTFVSREMPDMLKAAYSFGGLSLTQMAKPYVDHWIRTRDSVSDLIHSFSIMVLSTPMQQLLTGGSGRPLINRVAAFNKFRDNRGTFVVDKDQEDLKNISAPLGTLDKLLAQSQEQMASVSQIPIVKLLGITPSGLNASSDSEIRVFYDNVNAMQQQLFGEFIRMMLNIVQLSLFNEIDPNIDFSFESLWQMDEAQKATIRKQNADTAAVYIGQGVIEPEEERQRIAEEDQSPYAGLDLTKVIEPPGGETGYNGGGDDPDGDGGGPAGGGGAPPPGGGEHPGSNGGDRPSIQDVKFGHDDEPGATLYVNRPLKSSVDLRAWAKDQGITLDDNLHVTLAYSKEPFDWDPMADMEPLIVTGGARGIMRLGDKLVLRVDDPQLHERWKRIGELGAVWEFPPYLPHVSLCDFTADMDTTEYYPFGGQLVFGPEQWKEIDTGSKFAADAASWYEGDHKRDNGGKFAKTASNGATIDDSKVEKLHDAIKSGAAQSLGNKAKSKLSEIGKAHKGATKWDSVTPIESPTTPLHHNINAYIKHHQVGSDVPSDKPAGKLSKETEGWIELTGSKDSALKMAQEMFEKPGTSDQGKSEAAAVIKELTGKSPDGAKLPSVSSKMSDKTKEIGKGIKDNMDKVNANLKPAVENKLAELNAALDSQDKVNVAGVKPIANPVGMMQNAVNDYIASMKADLGIKSDVAEPTPAASYDPTPAQVKTATKINTAPPKRTHQEHYYEDADGKELKSVLKADTKKIPEGFYGKVMAAYGGDHSHKQGDKLTALDPVLESYANHVFTKQLTGNEVSATEAYQNGTYSGINRACNGLPPQPPSFSVQKAIDDLTSAMSKAVIPADTPLYRGVTCSLKELTGFSDPGEAVGRCFEHGNFASCSRSLSKAHNFSGGNIVMKFTAPAGARGITMRKQGWERELLLDKSSMFRVDKVEKGAEGHKHVVHCTFLGYKEANDES